MACWVVVVACRMMGACRVVVYPYGHCRFGPVCLKQTHLTHLLFQHSLARPYVTSLHPYSPLCRDRGIGDLKRTFLRHLVSGQHQVRSCLHPHCPPYQALAQASPLANVHIQHQSPPESDISALRPKEVYSAGKRLSEDNASASMLEWKTEERRTIRASSESPSYETSPSQHLHPRDFYPPLAGLVEKDN